jgi:diguanylate cyclase (GGDEF)-like protein
VPRGPDRRNQRKHARTPKRDGNRESQATSSLLLSVTISIGVAGAASDTVGADRVLECADKALYRAKANGRNRVEAAASPHRQVRKKAVGMG